VNAIWNISLSKYNQI